MAILNKTTIQGAHLYFARNGADDGGTPVSSSHAPAHGAGVLEELGAVESCDISNKIDELKLKAPVSGGGRYRTRQTIPLSQELMLKCKMQQANQLTFEGLFLVAGAITVGTAQQPLKQSAKITGWIELLTYDHADEETLRLFLYVELSVKSYKLSEKEYSNELEIEVLDNSLNTAKVVDLT